MMPIPFEVEKSVRRGTVILKVCGMLNTETRTDLEPYIEELEATPGLHEVIINMEKLTHIDSRGLSSLLSLHRHFTERDISFRLVNVNDYILRLFQVSNLVNLFEIGPAPEDQASLVHNRREALWQSHAFTTQLIAALGEAVLGTDEGGRILFANPAAERLLGWEEAELLGRSIEEALQPLDALNQPVSLIGHSALTDVESSPVMRLEASLTHRNGELYDAEMVATTIFQSGEKIGKVIGIRDLSLRRRAQDELKRLAIAVDQAAEMIVVTDPEGIIQYVNPAFEKITGYTRQEAVGKKTSLQKSDVQDPRVFADLWATIRSGKVWVGRFTNRRKDGRFYEEEATISPVHDSTGNIINFVAVKRDITQEILLEQQLRESQKFEAIAQLAGGIAHDFNNLLTSVIGNIQLARTKKGGDIQSYLEKAEQACLRGASLVQQLLLYSRKSPSSRELVNLNAIAQEVLALARETIDRRIEFAVQFHPQIPHVRADSSQMHQVLLNLLVNARDAIEEHSNNNQGADQPPSREYHPCIKVTTDHVERSQLQPPRDVKSVSGRYVILTVSDTGIGMEKRVQQHLFEPFFTTKEVGKGTGLGLATAYGIVQNHGGWIEVASQVGQGTTFKVFLPAEGSMARHSRSMDTSKTARGGHETILVVDDESSICEVAADILETNGYKTLMAQDGIEALEVYEKNIGQIDLVILDISMPKLSGKEVLERLRILNPQVKVIISSGYLTGEINSVSDRCVFVQKPYRTEDLLRGVREALDQPETSAF
ncbi:MAG: anti-sigma factor antagonist [Candidatus Omnitrophica bacterium]|nr:MAG: Blue-light-activated protein [Candidatus Hinthialibacteria bacterium OLB16]MBE7488250.1 anti-sigma factor antagonist [bacterium]MBK7497184.1 anti-sigma factor antagonist [Candidatus Omnitrophota bacterium]MCE7907509.1 PAS domain S-box protein [Candidatus Omnitrophica bacterium COP1]MBV6480524.1 Sensor histidine kinase RcsC [bacterium]